MYKADETPLVLAELSPRQVSKKEEITSVKAPSNCWTLTNIEIALWFPL